ncbi:hypothetical protein EA184_08730 [Escherichia coli]|nr:hypothetical protein EA184_08730 [Escherichia coli]PPZ06898.1 hypothetical protein C5P44_06390 [Escherichia coli]RBW86214.1 hypothetical protein DS960_14610 [Escherichia coli]RBX89295.1 hypothetical protein DS974_23050 [Escherichia coli]RBY00134.1 hypothetical protein DS987_12450 [Escherichia coli]
MRRNRLIRPTGWSTSQRCRPDKTRQRRIRQPARTLDVGCGVTALSDLRGGALHSGVGLITRVMNCTPNVGHNLTSEGAVYETFI